MYDSDFYEEQLKADSKLLNLRIGSIAHCQPCRIANPGFLSSKGVSMYPDRHIVDIDSELKNLGRLNSKCAGKDYKPYCPGYYNTKGQPDGYPCGGGTYKGPERSQPLLVHLPECDFNTIDTRGQTCPLKEVGYDRWDPLCTDPQNLGSIEFPGEVNVSYRNVIKDNFRPCLLTPMDQTKALPPNKGDLPCIPLSGVCCANFVDPLVPDRYTNLWPANYQPKQAV